MQRVMREIENPCVISILLQKTSRMNLNFEMHRGIGLNEDWQTSAVQKLNEFESFQKNNYFQ